MLLEEYLQKGCSEATSTIHPLEPYVQTKKTRQRRKAQELQAALEHKKKVVRPAHLEKAVEDTKDFEPAPFIFVSGDGDNIGSVVEQRVMANDLEGLIRQSEVIQQGQAYIKSSFETIDGKMLVHGGDDNLAVIKKEHMDRIEKIRTGYKKITGFTITFGVGNNMRDAVKALVYGKLTGKDKLVYWHDSINDELKELAKPQSPQEKYTEHGLLPEDIAEKAEIIEGGFADNKSSKKYNQKQLRLGIKIEMEHTDDPKKAKEIAMDHLEEIPDYYTRLEVLEDRAKEEGKFKEVKKADPDPGKKKSSIGAPKTPPKIKEPKPKIEVGSSKIKAPNINPPKAAGASPHKDDVPFDVPAVKGKFLDEPLTVGGKPVRQNDSHKSIWTGGEFDGDEGMLHTRGGSFKLHTHGHGTGSEETFPHHRFVEAMNHPEVQKVHESAMKNWFKIHNLAKQGKLPDAIQAHSALFTILSANNAVPMQELTYSRLVDVLKEHNVDPRSQDFGKMIGRGGKLNLAWHAADDPKNLPKHSNEYFKRIADSVIQQHGSEGTGRIPGDVMKMQYIDAMGDRYGNYPHLHDYLVDLYKKHGVNSRDMVQQMMNDKVEYKKAKNKALDHPMSRGIGMGGKVARFYASMMGGGNTVVPDRHFVRHIFGLDGNTDGKTREYLAKYLSDPRNHHLLNGVDNWYRDNHPAAKMVQDKYFGGKKDDNSVFPAFWLHWLAVSAHEKMASIGKPWAAKNQSDHTPYFDTAHQILDSHGLRDTEKSDGVMADGPGNDVPLPFRTASAVHDIHRKLGPAAASLMYYTHVVPKLLAHAESGKMDNMREVVQKNTLLKKLIKGLK